MEIELKIVTLNCWGIFTPLVCEKRHERLAAIADHLSTGEHDVVCLQEIWTDNDFDKIRKTMATSYPYSHYFHSNMIGSGCCIFSRYRIIETFFHRYALNGFPQRIYHGDWFGGKGVGMARIQCHQFNVNIYVTHFHAQYRPDLQDEYRPHRVVQAYEAARFIRLTATGSDAVVLAGDLNLHPDSLGQRTLIIYGGLEDAWCKNMNPVKDKYGGTTCCRPDNSFTSKAELAQYPHGQRLDYLLFAPNAGTDMVCQRCELTLGKIKDAGYNYSDHEGVMGVFRLRRAVTAAGVAPDGDSCRSLKRELDEEVNVGLDNVHRDRIFYTCISMLVVAAMWFSGGSPWLVGPGSAYLLFALWTLVVVKSSERRALQAVRDQLRFEFENEEGHNQETGNMAS